jgi:NedA-like, galactose-binding domain
MMAAMNAAKKLFLALFLPALLSVTPTAVAQHTEQIVVDTGQPVNSFSPLRALGGAVDRLRGGTTREAIEKHTTWALTDPVLKDLLGAGWGTVSYRQNTELHMEAWHWNPRGTWSNAAKEEGYFTGSAVPANEPIDHSWAAPLPHRGATLGDGNGWSRITDGDPKSYWKSNPYLTKAFTGEDDSLHPQWVMVDLGAKVDINAIKIDWANPYATHFYLQFWTGDVAPFYDGINKGIWQTFPLGTVQQGTGGAPVLKLANWKTPVRYLRIWMDRSSNTCDTHGAQDKRNCMGYAINELYLGTLTADGQFKDVVAHLPSRKQTITWPSSVDPWHAASDLDYSKGDQVGFDFFFHSGVTRGLPTMVPIAMLYATPEDAANEIAYLYKRKYPISWIEMGEEADGQRMLPEDYAALYLQFARAIHKLVPQARLGGPAFEGTPGDVGSWADANGQASFLGRFVQYLTAHHALNDFTFFSFEHYPCMGTHLCGDWDSLDMEPVWVNQVVQAWKDNGLPAHVPFFMTEGNDLGDGSPHTVKSGLWLADYVGAIMTAGAGGTYYFHYIALPGREGHGFLSVDEQNQADFSPQYLATQVITQEWVQPVDKVHKLFKATSSLLDGKGNEIVTAYPVERPDGQWSVMLVNKDETHDHSVRVVFRDPATQQTRYFSGTVDHVAFGSAEYQWRPDPVPAAEGVEAGNAAEGPRRPRDNGHADPDGPATHSTLTADGPDTLYDLPKASVIVLRGNLRPSP